MSEAFPLVNIAALKDDASIKFMEYRSADTSIVVQERKEAYVIDAERFAKAGYVIL